MARQWIISTGYDGDCRHCRKDVRHTDEQHHTAVSEHRAMIEEIYRQADRRHPWLFK